MRPVRFHPRVATDLDDAVLYYDGQRRGLGDDFLSEVRACAGMIAKIGQVVRRADGPYRHLKLPSFPYLVYYREDSDGFLITLVTNAAREPSLIQGLLETRR